MIVDNLPGPAYFEACFAGEPDGEPDVGADVSRGRALRRRRSLLIAAGVTTAGSLAVVGLLVVPSPRDISADPVASPSTGRYNKQGDVFSEPDVDRRLTYGANFSDPAPTSVRPTVTRQQALDLTKSQRPDGRPVAALRMIRSIYANAVPDVDGVDSTPRPYWVVVWDSKPGFVRGGVITDPKIRADWEARVRDFRAHGHCRTLMYVDAMTGRAPGVEVLCDGP